jgi:hypothetical protein
MFEKIQGHITIQVVFTYGRAASEGEQHAELREGEQHAGLREREQHAGLREGARCRTE